MASDRIPSVFESAKWIGYAQMDPEMRVVPGIHALDDKQQDKCIERSIVPLFRSEFQIQKPIRSATMHISGIGHYVLYLNGQQVGDRFLSPGWTLYSKRCLYNTFDLSSKIRRGRNAIGVVVGNGFYNINREMYRKFVVAFGFPRLIFCLRIEFRDGSVRTIVSDRDCKTCPSPITFSSIYGGENYDARMEQDGWNLPYFDDYDWQDSLIIHDPIGRLMPEEDLPVKICQAFSPKIISLPSQRRMIYDFGQNASGIVALRVRGNRGAQISIRPDELISNTGELTQQSGGSPYAWNYILKGDGIENWQPQFTYYGFRYVEVEIVEPPGCTEGTELVGIEMLHTRNSAPSVGSFSCSDPLLNRIYRLILWGIQSNLANVATDCPHREKLGWLEQTYLMGTSLHFNFDVHALYRKLVEDMIDSQLENGLVPDIAPEFVQFEGGFRDSPEWGCAAVFVPWLLYRWYGDMHVLRRAYTMMQRYVDYLSSQARGSMLDHGLGDWYDLGPGPMGEAQLTPKALTATATYHAALSTLAKIADLIGFPQDAQRYRVSADAVQVAYLDAFYDSKTGVCGTGSQTSYAISLGLHLLPKEERPKAVQNLIVTIRSHDFVLTTGDIGFHYLVQVLTEYGRSDVLYRMNRRTSVPGYGYQLNQGATALTESWAALPTSSQNHMMLGHLMEWFYAGLVGISQASDSVGYRHVIIAPQPVGTVRWAACDYATTRGRIEAKWMIGKGTFTLTLKLPKGSTGTIVLPPAFRAASCTLTNLRTGAQTHFRRNAGVIEVIPGSYILTAMQDDG